MDTLNTLTATDRTITNENQPKFMSTHLGREGHGFKDEHFYKTEDGFMVRISQASYGGKFLSVVPNKGVKMQFFKHTDDEQGWRDFESKLPYTKIDGDWGNLDKVEWSNDMSKIIGNEGILSGVVKVQRPNEEEQYFAIGAGFTGQADNWNVKTAYFRIEPEDAPKDTRPQKQIE